MISPHIAIGAPPDANEYLFWDKFSVDSDVNLESHIPAPYMPSPLASYTKALGGTAVVQCKAATGKAEMTAVGNGYGAWFVDVPGSANKTAKLKISSTGTAGFVGGGILCRAAVTGSTINSATYVAVNRGTINSVDIWDWTGPTLVARISIGEYQGTELNLVVTDDGTDITGYIEEEPTQIVSTVTGHVSEQSVYTPLNPSSTIFGLYIESGTAHTLEDFRILK